MNKTTVVSTIYHISVYCDKLLVTNTNKQISISLSSTQCQLSRANQWYIGYWIEGVVGEVYHKIQMVSCASAKFSLNNGISA